ncbi:MAG: hypothetical protein HQM04_10250 [Magnetococcales bacterium]|nr:hypothetical protein [Magnetococcales bacterium]MBF0115412.1 hypothetical protein [Magnetococcales bacterium]
MSTVQFNPFARRLSLATGSGSSAPSLSATQVSTIADERINAMTILPATALANLTTSQVAGLTSTAINTLADARINAMTILPATAVANLTTSQVAGLTSTNILALTASSDQTITGKKTLTNKVTLQNMAEKVTISSTAATDTVHFDFLTQQILYSTSSAIGNFTLNVRGDATTSLDSLLENNQQAIVVFDVTNGASAKYLTALTIDSNAITPKWQGGSAPTAGNASSVDTYVFRIIKTATATFTVMASITKFA